MRLAKIWASSLAVPKLVEQIHRHRHAGLDSRSRRLIAVFYCIPVSAFDPIGASPPAGPVRNEAIRLTEASATGMSPTATRDY